MAAWQGPAEKSSRDCWVDYLEKGAATSLQNQGRIPSCFTPEHRRTLGIVGLAPAAFRCTLDKMILTDPVRSPDGHAFEYTALAQSLARNGGVCPVTNNPLTLESCQRDGALQQQIINWCQRSHAA